MFLRHTRASLWDIFVLVKSLACTSSRSFAIILEPSLFGNARQVSGTSEDCSISSWHNSKAPRILLMAMLLALGPPKNVRLLPLMHKVVSSACLVQNIA